MNLIEQLTELVGFHPSYMDHFGKEVSPTEEARRALLTAMGYKLDNASLENSIKYLRESKWRNVLEPLYIIAHDTRDENIIISLPSDMKDELHIKIRLESTDIIEYTLNISELLVEEHQVFSDTSYTHYLINLPAIKEGYHSLIVKGENIYAESHLISAPRQCYTPKDANAEKVWGYAVQLYSLQSENNLGLSDFSDLKKLTVKAADTGASIIGLNPLHALYQSNPAHISPYSPSTRCYLNTLYIDVTDVINYSQCDKAQAKVNSPEFKDQISYLKSHKLLDYPYAAFLKKEILTLLFDDFYLHQNTKYKTEYQAFEDHIASEGEDLYLFATYEALYDYFTHNFSDTYSWKQWSKEYHQSDSPAVLSYQKENKEQILYFCFLQWVAHVQLSQVKETSHQAEMSIGLYLDMAVGCDGGGFDVWSDQHLFVSGASIGAPPDAMNNLGQNWGLTPMNPVELKSKGYQPLVKALRSSMKYAGAIRIDHILGLMRQYWVAPGMKADEGMYIGFPFDDILRIIALESQRNQCVVIGEDLGIVPEGFSEKMQSYGLLSYKIMFFERWWETGLFKRPETYTSKAMITASTHDLPTIKGWWMGRDLEWRQKLELYPTDEIGKADRDSRNRDRVNLIAALKDFNVLSDQDIPSLTPPEINRALTLGVQKYLAHAPSAIHLIPLEDALEITEQVNIPGTTDEHPNWRQKLPVTIDEIWEKNAVIELSAAMRIIRPIQK